MLRLAVFFKVYEMTFCLLLDYATGSSWIDEVGESEYPAMLEDGGGFMFRLAYDLDAYSRQVLLQSLRPVIGLEMRRPGSQHDAIRDYCEGAVYFAQQA